jgi:hypothetical protein
MKYLKSILVTLLLSTSIGCTTLTTQQKAEYDQMKENNVLVQEKDPTTGAWLGLLPGFGAFYGREPLVGVVDLLSWPVSILWDPVVGYETSKKVNYHTTKGSLERNNEKELIELDNEQILGEISDAEYVAKKRVIEQKYNY